MLLSPPTKESRDGPGLSEQRVGGQGKRAESLSARGRRGHGCSDSRMNKGEKLPGSWWMLASSVVVDSVLKSSLREK